MSPIKTDTSTVTTDENDALDFTGILKPDHLPPQSAERAAHTEWLRGRAAGRQEAVREHRPRALRVHEVGTPAAGRGGVLH